MQSNPPDSARDDSRSAQAQPPQPTDPGAIDLLEDAAEKVLDTKDSAGDRERLLQDALQSLPLPSQTVRDRSLGESALTTSEFQRLLRQTRQKEASDPHRHTHDRAEPAKEIAKELASARSNRDNDDTHPVLYLAYGSNMCAKTFLGRRGIRPVAKINVTAPSARLTFDLPGVPFCEPRFANISAREPEPEKDALLQAVAPLKSHGDAPTWNRGLIGVVYQISIEDYAHIFATEGGGTAYKDVVVECYPLDGSESAAPFKAHTLYCPHPDKPDEFGHDAGRSDENDPLLNPTSDSYFTNRSCKQTIADFFTRRAVRPEPEGLPSERYIGLLQLGARENGLPAAYQSYLDEKAFYRPQTWQQRVGWAVTLACWVPVFLFVMKLGQLGSKFTKDGLWPVWIQWTSCAAANLVWASYDHLMKPLLGEGEH